MEKSSTSITKFKVLIVLIIGVFGLVLASTAFAQNTGYTYGIAGSGSNAGGGTTGGGVFLPTGSEPIVRTGPATSVKSKSAILTGYITSDNSPTNVWFEYSTSNLIAHGTEVVSTIGGTQTVRKTVVGLAPNTTYYYKACAENGTSLSCGSVLSFKTAKISTTTTNTDTKTTVSKVETEKKDLISETTWTTIIRSVIFLAILIIAIALALRIFNSGH